MIKVENIHKEFKKHKVLKGVDFEVNPGKVYAILGPNGSGKTTMIKSILGMVRIDNGAIYIDGGTIKNSADYRKNIDYLPQIANFPSNLKVKELFKMIQNIRNVQADATELIDLFKLQPYLNKKLNNLSGGTKQKVNLVLTFMFDSPIIILDEPTSGLDPVAMVNLKKLILREKTKNKLILMTSHIIGFVEEMADDVIFLLEGVIYFKGEIPALLAKTQQHSLENAIAHLITQENNEI